MKNSIRTLKVDKKQPFRRITNIFLLAFSIIMIFSGLYIQIHYHVLGGNISGFSAWTLVHKWSSMLFTFTVVSHMALHIKWYKIVLDKRLYKKNRVTLFLSILTFVVSLLGFIPWILNLFLANSELRHILIEIHDKIGLLFMVIVMGHIINRRKWYLNMR